MLVVHLYSQLWHFTLKRVGDPGKPVQWWQCHQSSAQCQREYIFITLAEFALKLIATNLIVFICLQTFLFLSMPGPVPPWPGVMVVSWPRSWLGTCCCYILTSLPAESVLVPGPGRSAVSAWHHHYQPGPAGSQSANSGPSDYPASGILCNDYCEPLLYSFKGN